MLKNKESFSYFFLILFFFNFLKHKYISYVLPVNLRKQRLLRLPFKNYFVITKKVQKALYAYTYYCFNALCAGFGLSELKQNKIIINNLIKNWVFFSLDVYPRIYVCYFNNLRQLVECINLVDGQVGFNTFWIKFKSQLFDKYEFFNFVFKSVNLNFCFIKLILTIFIKYLMLLKKINDNLASSSETSKIS